MGKRCRLAPFLTEFRGIADTCHQILTLFVLRFPRAAKPTLEPMADLVPGSFFIETEGQYHQIVEPLCGGTRDGSAYLLAREIQQQIGVRRLGVSTAFRRH